MWSIYKKELIVYFNSLLGYIVMSIYLLIAGIFFIGYYLGAQTTNDFSNYFADMNTTFLFTIPVLTLRILSEDKKLGTYELLLTSPITPAQIILGKFLAIYTFVFIGSTLLLLFPLVLNIYTTIEWQTVLSGYIGILFSLAFFISVGMFASSLTDNYVIVGLISFGLFILLYLIAFFGNSPDSNISKIFKEISYANHYQQFASGLIKLKNIVYFILGTFFWLYLSKTIIESKTWK